MKLIFNRSYLFIAMLLALAITSCKNKDDDGFITNDFRLLQVNIDGDAATTGATNVSVVAELGLVFSHKLSTSAFESGLAISPSVAYTLNYDNSGSIVTLISMRR
ncbi:MAG: hypothetical protein R2825_12370 [Saprospiraceae bacterium]